MYTKEIIINNKTGLHARPASELAEFCNRYKSEIIITTNTDEEEIYAKSIVSILSGGVYSGTKILLKVEGCDEDSAGPEIAHLLENLPD